MNTRSYAALAGALVSLPWLAATASEHAGGTSVGDRPGHSFRAELLNSGGAKSLADLAGKPVLVDFWGTKCPPCVGFAVPKGVEMQRTYGDDLQVLFIESQGSDIPAIERFAYERSWMGTNAAWTNERPFDVGLDGIPHFALLDIEGEIILQGYTSELHSQLEKLVEEQVEAVRKGPKDLDKGLRAAWKTMAKGEFAKAIEEARKAETKGATGVQEFVTMVHRRAEQSLRKIAWMVDNGRAAEGQERLAELVKSVAGLEGIAERAAELNARLAAPETASELEAARALQKLEASMAEDGLEARGLDKKLEKIAEKFAGTKAAARATHLRSIVEATISKG